MGNHQHHHATRGAGAQGRPDRPRLDNLTMQGYGDAPTTRYWVIPRMIAAAPAATRLKGIGLLLIAVSVIPVMDALAKELGGRYPVLQVTWGRYFFNLVLILPIVFWRYGPRAFAVPQRGLQIVRGTLLLTATYLFFFTLTYLPLADTLALIFLYPLVVTLLSPWLLGEEVGWRRMAAVVMGFIGALIIIRPGTTMFQPVSLLGLGISLCLGLYMVMTRRLAGSAPSLVTLAYGALFGAVACSIAVPTVWTPPSALDWVAMVAMGGIAALGHLLIIRAYEAAPATVLAPLGYAEMVSAVIVGYLWFGDFPDALTWLGIAVIVASGVYVSWRESRLKAREEGRERTAG